MGRMRQSDWGDIHRFAAGDVPSWEKLDRDLLVGIDGMASRLNARPVFLSTWRSEEHNANIGGAKDSQHVLGNAGDVTFPGKTLEEMYQAAVAEHFGGIGLYPDPGQNFIHVDTRSNPGTWSRIKGVYTSLAAAFEFLKKKRDSQSGGSPSSA